MTPKWFEDVQAWLQGHGFQVPGPSGDIPQEVWTRLSEEIRMLVLQFSAKSDRDWVIKRMTETALRALKKGQTEVFLGHVRAAQIYNPGGDLAPLELSDSPDDLGQILGMLGERVERGHWLFVMRALAGDITAAVITALEA